MHSKTLLATTLLAAVEARFGQEQTPVSFITALSNFGDPGVAATLAGAVPGVLLAAADPCDKLTLADQIVTELGDDPDVIAGAQQIVAAEQNFNPFVVSVPNICGDASLPATEALRGIVPLIDPAVTGSDVENANSASSLTSPLDATGLSVADVMIAAGFSNFTVNGAAAGAAGGADSGASSVVISSATSAVASATSAAQVMTMTTVVKCGTAVATATVTSTAAAAATSTPAASSGSAAAAAGAGAVSDPVTGTFAGFQASSLGLDFGTCTPTVKFEESLNGRKAGEFTFQAQDPVVNQGQQEALNPAIIFNRICDQLVNVCGVESGSDAHTLCESTKDTLGSGAKDQTTADAWNTALGFDGTDINPDNAPQTGLVGHT
ncbi:hypothetical protein F5Y18DRAFT_310107 [Xylariaceae sp. FL1019]|nr:hypothetical protein F5Y18DRAFT_310107 [Xylariaceae sp. FL1019]